MHMGSMNSCNDLIQTVVFIWSVMYMVRRHMDGVLTGNISGLVLAHWPHLIKAAPLEETAQAMMRYQ
jgi:hypothetical protein